MRPSPFFFVLLAACSIERGSGDAATETRSFDATEAISVESFVEVDIELGADIRAIDLTCDDNLLEHIVTEVEGSTLVIRTERGMVLNPRTTCTASVKLPALRELHVAGSGSGKVSSPIETLERVTVSGSGSAEIASATACEVELRVSGSGALRIGSLASTCGVEATVSGSGALEVAGSAEELVGRVSGSGALRASELHVRDLDGTVSGSGDLYGFASESAVVRISGSGSVHLFGDTPDVNSEISGSGELLTE